MALALKFDDTKTETSSGKLYDRPCNRGMTKVLQSHLDVTAVATFIQKCMKLNFITITKIL